MTAGWEQASAADGAGADRRARERGRRGALRSGVRAGLAAALLASSAAACGSGLRFVFDPAPAEPEGSVLDLYLMGDAGRPNPAGEPMLIAMKRVIQERGAERAVVAFLGDNIYPDGLPTEESAYRREAERMA